MSRLNNNGLGVAAAMVSMGVRKKTISNAGGGELPPVPPLDLGSVEPSGNDLDLSSTTTIGYPYGLTWKPDGTKLYISGIAGQAIAQFSAPSTWSLKDIVLDVQISTSRQYLALDWGDDGNSLYVLNYDIDKIEHYQVSIPWEVDSEWTLISDIPCNVNYGYDFAFDYFKTTLLVLDRGGKVTQHKLDVPGDLTSVSESKTILVFPNNTFGLAFYNGDEKILGLDGSGGFISQWSFNGDIENTVQDLGSEGQPIGYNSGIASLTGIYIRQTGGKLYLSGFGSMSAHEFTF